MSAREYPISDYANIGKCETLAPGPFCAPVQPRHPVEGPLLQEVKRAMKGKRLRLRCLVPKEEQPQGGRTIYGPVCGLYPIGPTLVVE